MQRAAALSPSDAEAHSILGGVLHDLGRLDEAAASYRRALEIDPGFVEVHGNLGNILQEQGRLDEAAASYRRALQINPDFAGVHSNLGNTLKSMGRLDEAEASYRRALEINPVFAGAHVNLSDTLREQGRLDEAEASCRRALEINPDFVEAHGNLGNTLQGLGRLVEAEASYRRALEINPEFVEAHSNLGNTLQGLGRLVEAEASYRRALEINPDLVDAHCNLGNTLQEQSRLVEAAASYRRALEIDPDFAEAHNSLGNILQAQGRPTEAEASYRCALEFNPDLVEAHNNLGNTLQDLGRLVEAEAVYRRALEIKPDFSAVHSNLGNTLKNLGRLAEAEASCRRALQIKPDFAAAYSNLGTTLQGLGRLDEAVASYRRALELSPDFSDAHSNLIFTIDLSENYSIGEQQAERRRWYEQHGRRHAEAIRPHDNLPDPERRLRIGFVSADFRRHSAYYIFSPIIARLDRKAFEVVCYSGVKVEDDATARLRQDAHDWQSTLGVSDEALAEQIRRDRIDVLVDLSGHSAGNRLLVFARKPAPVQVTAWGYATGTGLETIDYFLADPVTVPQEERSLYAEEVIDLPCVICYDPPDYLPEVSPLPTLGARPFTFGCINRIEKITDRMIALWGRILAALPEAQLLLKDRVCDDAKVRQQLLQRLSAAGVAAQRVRILGYSPHLEHLKVFCEVDVGLDPFPHGGGISTAEALWMGVPVVTLSGSTIPSRLSASILTALAMQDWIAHSDEAYVRIAVEAARDLPTLARLRGDLRSRLAASALGDVQRYTREVEAALRSVWRRWCAQPGRRAGNNLLRSPP